ncbi:hypothetical protein PsYK624_086620 [Phanerochaete sordida]|uniref:BTB domain-containing protein n=1 Tax=Phanerochaete sordida TaxID=48140 RepID=A0A9P3GAL7_9APHY|nr:hypothetical protein PsYK624_086620 [Phanerochaete sordida]
MPDGVVGHPHVVYASSAVLKASSSHFAAQLNGSFSATDEIPVTSTDYGYEDDSDLDDDEKLEDELGSEASVGSSAEKANRLKPTTNSPAATTYVTVPRLMCF